MGSLRQTMSKFWLGNSDQDYAYDEYDAAQGDTWEEDYDHELTAESAHTVAEVTPLPTARNVQPERHRIVTIRPTTFEEATSIATVIRDGDPVIVNLSEASQDLARRMLDFMSGVVYVLDGGIETITQRVYLLSPGSYSVDNVQQNESRFSIR